MALEARQEIVQVSTVFTSRAFLRFRPTPLSPLARYLFRSINRKGISFWRAFVKTLRGIFY